MKCLTTWCPKQKKAVENQWTRQHGELEISRQAYEEEAFIQNYSQIRILVGTCTTLYEKNLWAAPATLTPWSFSFHYWCQLLVLNLPIHNIESCSIVRQETIILLSNDGTRLGLIANINIRFKLSLLYSGDAIVIESGDKPCRKYSICIIKSLLDSNDSAS